jgi:hypothetical protein
MARSNLTSALPLDVDVRHRSHLPSLTLKVVLSLVSLPPLNLVLSVTGARITVPPLLPIVMAGNLLSAHLLRKDATTTDAPSQIPRTRPSMLMLMHGP